MEIRKATRQIPLTKGLFAIIDEDCAEIVANKKWYAMKTNTGFYAATNAPMVSGKRGKTLLMHRLILGDESAPRCDHRNGDTLDNRRENLRPATISQNAANSKRRFGTSKYRGVNWDKQRNLWAVFITIGTKRKNLGRYASEDDAGSAYNNAAKVAFGEFARLNQIQLCH